MTALHRLYLDHAATTPICAEARAAMDAAMDLWANPSSPHADGRRAKAMLEDARARIAAALDWTGAVLFTGGASEAIAIAMNRALAGKRLMSAVEHDAVRSHLPADAAIAVGADGYLDMAALHRMLAEAGERPLVAVQSVNSETGVIQPLAEIGAVVRGAGGLLLADCAQSAGRMALPDADIIALSAHKFGGPPGVGALLVRDLGLLRPTGGQERGYRRGTENLPAIAAMAAALEAQGAMQGEQRLWLSEMADHRAFLDHAVAEAGGHAICGASRRSPLVATYYMPGISSAAQLVRFDMAGISVSAGSACSSGTMKPSHVMEALNLAPDVASNLIRVSFGRGTTRADVERFAALWREMAAGAAAQEGTGA